MRGFFSSTYGHRGHHKRVKKSQSLLHSTDLTYVGGFRVPRVGLGGSTFSFGGTTPGYNPNNDSLFLVGHDVAQQIAEISIPTPVNSSDVTQMPVSTALQEFNNLIPNLPDPLVDGNGVKVGGLLVINGKLYGTVYAYYDADFSADKSHWISDLDFTNSEGAYTISGLQAGYYGGYMCTIPNKWQSALGAAYMVGQSALSIISRTSSGPAVFGFDPNDIGPTPATVIPYVYYPVNNPLEPYHSTNPRFNGTTFITGIVFPEDTDSILFFGSHGHGTYCYGSTTFCGDGARSGTGPHAPPYLYQVWAYDVQDFILVKNGNKQPWEIEPYDIWQWSPPNPSPTHGFMGGAAYDPTTKRIYLSQERSDIVGTERYPVIQVFNHA